MDRALLLMLIGFILLFVGVGVMPSLGQWSAEYGVYLVMLPYMLWMMLAGGLVSTGTRRFISCWRATRSQ
ncbi:hypothetical protein [Corynebacterium pelargi]|uniref:Uncharacterized protein n=1 Tax=Corynebacterium pelargi TaxID=1471400 RepID=A0A410WBS3_9CORY|nr:hypothetical protein [Corynebacterium pelargi]QAU53403.1 hypothetical protein CPELA_10805 [Corynebacterium pelargi]QAU53407.1 hypothetical protein CPELA_10825 [Corynebacterium pelargi]GGG82588.1 hypothetical protein GCM10007338_21920 [Corynebacterium pelargi]